MTLINSAGLQAMPAGPPGKSAYQAAVDNGFIGTVAQWLVSLQGAPGVAGAPGAPGAAGPAAAQSRPVTVSSSTAKIQSGTTYVGVTAIQTGGVTLNLPAAAGYQPGTGLDIADETGSCSTALPINILASGTDSIASQASLQMQVPNERVRFVSNGSGLWTITGVIQPPTATTLGGVFAAAAGANQVQTGISTTGQPTFAQLGFGNLSGQIVTAQFPQSGVTAGSYGGAASSLTATVDATGRVTSLAAQTVSITISQINNLGAGVAGALGAASTGSGGVVLASGGSLTNPTINSGSIGATSPGTGAFTTLTTTTSAAFAGSVTVPTPGANDNSAAAVNSQWVRNLVSATVQQLTPKPTATVATAAALPTYTYSNGTITASANGALVVDGYADAAGDVVLVKNEIGANAPYNGLYTVNNPGSSSAPFVLTRQSAMSTSSEFAGALVPVGNAGATTANSIWLCNPSGAVTIGTTAIAFTQLNGATDLIAGNGININGNTISSLATTISGTFLAANVTGSSLTGVGTLTSGATGAGFTINLGASTILGALGLANGGVGATTAAGARSNLGAAASGANTDITSLAGLTTPLSIAQGGTGAGNGTSAAASLGITGRTSVNNASPTATAASRTIAFTALSAAQTVTLPSAASFPTGTQLLVVDESGACSATNTITLTPNGSDKINGAASAIVAQPYGYVAIESNGAGAWTIVDQSVGSLTLDGLFGATRATVIVRGASGWQGLTPTTNGQTLQYNGSDTVFAAASPGSGAVRYDTTQTLTAAQQAQTLANIGGVAGGMVNKWRNAALDVWQRGTAAMTISTSGQYTADGYFVRPAGAAVTVAVAAGRARSVNSLKITGASGNTDVQVVQPIESYVAAPLAGQVCLFQAWIYNGSGASITPTLTVKHPTALDNYASSTTDVSAVSLQACVNGAWTQVACAFTASSALLGMEITLDLGALASGTLQLCEVDVRAAPGLATGLVSAPPPAELRPITAEMAINQRYFFGTFPPGTTPAQNAGTSGCFVFANAAASGNPGVSSPTLSWPVPMRATPTVALYNPSAGNAQVRCLDANADWSGTAVFLASFNGVSFTGTQAGSGGQHSGVHVTATAEIAP